MTRTFVVGEDGVGEILSQWEPLLQATGEFLERVGVLAAEIGAGMNAVSKLLGEEDQ